VRTSKQNRPRSIWLAVPTCPHGYLMEIPFIKVAIFQVQNGQILTFRILTHGVEAALASFTHRSSTHVTTLTRMGSIGFTWVVRGAGERLKFVSQSKILIDSAISCNSPVDRASHTPWRTLPTHIIASPQSCSSLPENYSCEGRSLSHSNSFTRSHLSPQPAAQ
jgi:hypothetical protein